MESRITIKIRGCLCVGCFRKRWVTATLLPEATHPGRVTLGGGENIHNFHSFHYFVRLWKNPVFFVGVPDALKIHPWFATDKLKAFNSRDGTYPAPTDSKEAEEEEYEVEKVLEHDEERDAYLVKWKGYPPEDNSWEPAMNLQNAQRKYGTSGDCTAPTDRYTKLAESTRN
jgi:hypothetical protein